MLACMRRLVVLVGIALAARAGAYEEGIHALLEERALPPELLGAPIVPATLDDADALRLAVWREGATHPDLEVRRAFIARYPTAEGFDRWAWKQFLGLTPEADVFGIDRLPPMPARLAELVAAGAREPDDDRRNQERFAHDAARKVRVDEWGNPLPLDPDQLDMGGLRGTASQAYAHYGLPKIEFSDSPDVLKKEPWRFAYPPTAKTFGPDFAQEFTDLAIAAATVGRDGGPALGWLFLAQADHYIGDVANQIHTLQAIYPFFFDAKIESYKEELRSLGGLLRSRPDFVTIGIGIIKNHHLLTENLWSKRILAAVSTGGPPGVAAGLAAIRGGDAALEQALDARKLSPQSEFGRAIAEEVIAASCREGGEVYEAIRELAKPELSRVGGNYDMGLDPDAFLRADPEPGTLEKFYRLEAAGFARAGSALRWHARLYASALEQARGGDDARQAVFVAAARRLVADQLALAAQAEARLSAWKPKPPQAETINWMVPGGLAVLLLLVTGIPSWLVVRSRRRRARRPAS